MFAETPATEATDVIIPRPRDICTFHELTATQMHLIFAYDPAPFRTSPTHFACSPGRGGRPPPAYHHAPAAKRQSALPEQCVIHMLHVCVPPINT